MTFMDGRSRYTAACEVLCASRQPCPALLLAVPVSCPRAALGDPILTVLVQALQNFPWGTEEALLCWVL